MYEQEKTTVCLAIRACCQTRRTRSGDALVYRGMLNHHDEIVRLYGPWRARTHDAARDCSRGTPGAGGSRAAGHRAFTGVSRPHGDVDPSIPRSDVQTLRRHVSGRLDVWEADEGVLRPVVDEAHRLSETCENLWLRPGGADPWEYDVILMHASPTTWTYKRDVRISRPLDEILWEREGITYLRPRSSSCTRRRACARRTRPTSTPASLSSTRSPGPGCVRRWPPPTRVIRGCLGPLTVV